jgi:hypothetical protein
MWIFTRTAFLSLVEHEEDENLLSVRARFPGDIEEVFPGADVAETPDRDYRYRATVPRDRAAQLIALQVKGVDYTAFKSTVPDDARKATYIRIWTEMWKAQSEAGSS